MNLVDALELPVNVAQLSARFGIEALEVAVHFVEVRPPRRIVNGTAGECRFDDALRAFHPAMRDMEGADAFDELRQCAINRHTSTPAYRVPLAANQRAGVCHARLAPRAPPTRGGRTVRLPQSPAALRIGRHRS